MKFSASCTITTVSRCGPSAGFPTALDAALARREVWQNSGERLLGVAAEIAEMADRSRDKTNRAVNPEIQKKLTDEVLTTLWEAHDSGWPREVDLATDKRFAQFRTNDRFVALMNELTGNATDSTVKPLPATRSSGSTN